MIDDMLPSLVQNPQVRVVFYFGLVLVAIYLTYVLCGWLRDYLAEHLGATFKS